MKRADPREGIARLSRHANVAELGVIDAEDGAAAHDDAHANTSAHRDVGVVIEPHGGAPAPFRERRAIDIGVHAYWGVDAPGEPAGDIGITPARLGGGRDEAEGR